MPLLRSLLTSWRPWRVRRGAGRCRLRPGPDQDHVGKVVGGNGFHIPSYVAESTRHLQAGGARCALHLADRQGAGHGGLSGNLDFVPIPSGGAQAALSGAEIRYIVGKSMTSQWVFVTRGDITKVEDLKGKTIGYGRARLAPTTTRARPICARFFNMQVGKDYKVIAYPGRAGAHCGAAQQGHRRDDGLGGARRAGGQHGHEGDRCAPGDKMPRVGGTFWSRARPSPTRIPRP